MEKFEYFSEIYGLVTEADPISENGGLFLAQYMSYHNSWKAIDIYLKKMKNARTTTGLYKRSAKHNERSVSHDEVTGMMVSSYLINSTHRHEIWQQLKANYGAYPAVVMDRSDRLPFNPANYYCWGQLAGSIASYLFLPLYFINMMIALTKNNQDTSSKIMYDLELRVMPKTIINKILKKVLDIRLKSMYGSNFRLEMLKIYFNKEKQDFPLFQVVK